MLFPHQEIKSLVTELQGMQMCWPGFFHVTQAQIRETEDAVSLVCSESSMQELRRLVWETRSAGKSDPQLFSQFQSRTSTEEAQGGPVLLSPSRDEPGIQIILRKPFKG